jgi:ferritin-like metal-binding protein YciE
MDMELATGIKRLFTHELQILLGIETTQLDSLQPMIDRAETPALKYILEEQLAETVRHKTTLEIICQELSITLEPETGPGISGILEAGKITLAEHTADQAIDLALIAIVQKVKYHEMACYCTAAQYAEALGYTDIAKRLNLNLEEERLVDKKLNFQGMAIINSSSSTESPLEVLR